MIVRLVLSFTSVIFLIVYGLKDDAVESQLKILMKSSVIAK